MVRRPDGRFEFRGRRMHIIRRGGENLSTYALELDLQSCPLVSDVAVTAESDETLDARVVAHVIPGRRLQRSRVPRLVPGCAGQGAASRTWCGRTPSSPRTGSGRVIARDLA